MDEVLLADLGNSSNCFGLVVCEVVLERMCLCPRQGQWDDRLNVRTFDEAALSPLFAVFGMPLIVGLCCRR